METTLCLIVKNGAKQLPECIKSFQGLFSEILIIDTGSKDNTIGVSKELGAAVFSYEWEDDFSKARNFALSKVKTEWILIVDADDRIKEKDNKALQKKLKNLKKTVKIISCPYVYSQTGQVGPRYRFFKTNLGLEFTYPVHEKLQIPKKYENNHQNINVPFIHEKKKEDFNKGFKRNIKIMDEYIKDYPKDLRILYYLSHDNYHLKNYEETIKWCDEFLKNNPNNTIKTGRVLTRKGLCYAKLNMKQEAIKSYLKAIREAPDFIEPYLYLGDIAKKEGKLKEANEFYKMAGECELSQNDEMSFNQALYNN